MMLERDDTNKVVRAYLAEHPEIVTEGLPSYAPETNPDESVWQYTRYSRLSNLAPEDTRELRKAMVEELNRLHGRPDLLMASSRHARIPFRLQRLSC
jgi:transposase